jgi:ribose transport system substrate-binding protein
MVQRFLQGTGSTEARAAGFIAKAKDHGLEIVADPYPEDGSVAGCKKASANTLEGFVKDNKLELDGIFACNLYSALGMLAALEDLNKGGVETNVYFIGFDSSPKLNQGVMGGKIGALVVQNPHKMGGLAVETLVNHLRGKTVEKTIDTGVELVTKERLENEPAMRKLVGMDK